MAKIQRVCQQCGVEFHIFPSRLKGNAGLFCGSKCMGLSRRKPIADRFWAMVNKTDSCWLWTGSTKTNGYGYISVARSVSQTVHRVSWELANGPIPDGLWVLHRCDVRHCVNPAHLFLGTHDDNMADMRSKGRQPRPDWRGERNGRAKLTREMVASVRSRYAAGGVTMCSLADELGVTESAVWHIISRRTWTDA